MPQEKNSQSEIFLVHQDDVWAKVQVAKAGSSWSVTVQVLDQPGNAVVRMGHGLGIPGTLFDAREAGIRNARSQIAQTLGREPSEIGHVLWATSEKRADLPDYFDAIIAVKRGDGVVHRHLMTPVQKSPMTDEQAVEFAAQLMRKVSGFRDDGTLIIGR